MSLFKSASLVSVLTLASRVTGLMRELLVAATFGASVWTDAFNVAFRIPNLLRRLFAEGAFAQAFVPVLAASKAQNGDTATRQLIDQVSTVLSWIVFGASVLGVVLAPVLVWLMAAGLQNSAQGFEAAVLMTRWMFPYIAFMALVALAAGVLNTYGRFVVPAATPILLNLSMMAAVWWGAPLLADGGVAPIYALSAGVLLGGVLQLGLQWWALQRLGRRPRLGWTWRAVRGAWAHPGTQKIIGLMLPALWGVSVAQISLLINTQIASHLGEGRVSWLTYADRLMEFPVAMLGVALGVVLTPQLAAARAAQDEARYSSLLDWGLRWVLLLTVPSALALLLFAQPLVAALYQYGRFTAQDVQQTAWALSGYGVGLMGLVGLKVLASAYYARQDLRTPVKVASVVLVLTQLLNLLLVPFGTHAGLALSIGLGALFNAAWLLRGLLRRGIFKPEPGWRRLLVQVLLASALMGVFLWLVAQSLNWSGLGVSAHALAGPWVEWDLRQRVGWRIAALVLSVSGAAVLYFALLWFLGFRLQRFVRK